ncbi:hypothetical protein N9B43_01855 [Mariniblastus sp.]|nr:hypothetical protein [bacterium]MDA7905615.1 hypothetical protein [Mariniblastus sp.]
MLDWSCCTSDRRINADVIAMKLGNEMTQKTFKGYRFIGFYTDFANRRRHLNGTTTATIVIHSLAMFAV